MAGRETVGGVRHHRAALLTCRSHRRTHGHHAAGARRPVADGRPSHRTRRLPGPDGGAARRADAEKSPAEPVESGEVSGAATLARARVAIERTVVQFGVRGGSGAARSAGAWRVEKHAGRSWISYRAETRDLGGAGADGVGGPWSPRSGYASRGADADASRCIGAHA